MICIKCSRDLPPDALYCPYCGKKQASTQRRRTKRPNGLGTVYKLSGKRRRPYAVVKDGQYVSYHATRTEALEALNRLSGQTVREKINWTFAEVYAAWSQEHFPEVGPSGREQYARAFAVFADLHNRKFRDLRTADFQKIMDQYADRSRSTTGKYKQLLTQLSDWAIREEIITTSFAHYVTVKGRESRGHVPMTEEDIRKLTQAAEHSETAKIVCMLLATGLRIGELLALRLEDCHGTYVIGGEKSDAGRNRVIPIRPEGRVWFDYFERLSTAAGLPGLLDSYVGNHDVRNFRERDYYPLLDSLGIDRAKTPHSTRTTYSTRAVSEDLSPAYLQKVLGHADFGTTQKYYDKPSAETLVRAVEQSIKKPGPSGSAAV